MKQIYLKIQNNIRKLEKENLIFVFLCLDCLFRMIVTGFISICL